MNSRDRVKLALNHEEADRVPIDLGSMRSSGISTIAYINLLDFLGKGNLVPKMYDFIQQLAYPHKEILDLFNIDVIDVGQAFLKNDSDWKPWQIDNFHSCLIPAYLNIEKDKDGNVFLKNNEGIILGKKPKSSLYVDQAYWVYKDLQSLPDSFDDKELNRHMWAIPSPPWYLDIFNEKDFKVFKDTISDLYHSTDYSLMLSLGCNLFETGTFLRSFDNFLCDIYLNKLGTQKLLDSFVEKNLLKIKRVLEGVKDYVDIIMFGDDLGSQDMPFISPDKFREIFKPFYKKMWDCVHENSNCKVFLHSCGSIYKLIPDLIDAGLDILNPVQTSAKDMEPEKLKKEFGKYITFWGGGCDTQEVLPNWSPNEIKRHVKERIEIFSKNGGFVFCQVHNILANIPPENVVAMLEAVNEFGKY